MKKLILLLFILPIFCFAQTNITPQWKKFPVFDSLGYSITGSIGNHWLYDAHFIRVNYLTKSQFTDSLRAHKIYFTNNFQKIGDTIDLAWGNIVDTINAHGADGIVSGLITTTSGTTATTTAGTYRLNNAFIVKSTSTNTTIPAQNATQNRYTLIVGDASGVFTAVNGTLADDPVEPDIPTNKALIASIYIPKVGGTTTTTGGGTGKGTVTKVSSSTTDILVANQTTTPILTLNKVNGIPITYYDATSSIQTQINGKQATLGFTPYNATNPSGYIALTALSATSPIFYNNTTGVISSQAASASQNGYTTFTDWSTFNGKQAALTLTTTGTSGAATLIGATLNIPQYSGGSGVTTIGSFSGSSQTNGASISGSTLTFGPADGTNPGMVSTGTQTITGAKTLTSKLSITAGGVSNSQLAVGSYELQSYTVNNAWLGENAYYNGSNFVFRASGYGALVYFNQREVQVRYDSGVAGATATNLSSSSQMKININGSFAVGSSLPAGEGSYTNAKLYVSSGGRTIFNSSTDNGTDIGQFNGTVISGIAGTTLGTYKLAGNTSGTISIKPQAAAGTYEFDMPTTAGVSGQVLTSQGGAGTAMAWVYPISKSHTIFTPTTGGTVTLINNQYNIINPAGSLVALTVTLPSSPANNDCVYIKYTQAVTTVTYSGGTVVDGITAPTAGGLVVLTYDSGTTSWY